MSAKHRYLATAGVLLLIIAAAAAGPFRDSWRRAWFLRAEFDEVRPGVYLREDLHAEARARALAALDAGRAQAAAWIGGLRHRADLIVVDDERLHGLLGLTNRFVENGAADGARRIWIGPRGLTADLVAHGHLHAEIKQRIGVAAWSRLPAWFDEGVCTQVDRREFLQPCAVGWPGREALADYADRAAFRSGGDDALVVAKRELQRWIARCGGPQAVSALLDALARGEDFAAAYAGMQAEGARRELATIERVRGLYEQRRAEQGFPGLAFGWCFADGGSGCVAVGVRERGGAEPLLAGDRMLWGGVGKTFVAALVLRMAQDGALGLDDRLAEHLGDWEGYSRLPNAAQATLRQLLTQRSGIPDHLRKPQFWEALRAEPERNWSARDLAAWVHDDPPLAAPGARFDEADTNFVLLGGCVEERSGRGLFAEIQAELVERFRLRDLAPSDRRELPGLVQGHPVLLAEERGIPDRTLADGKLFINPQFEHGGGGMYGTADALARWTALLHSGPVLDEARRAARASGAPVAEGAEERYGLGAQLWPSPRGVAVGHGGWFPGYRTETAWFAELGLAAAVMVNTDAPQEVRSLRRLLLDGVDALLQPPAPEEPQRDR